MAAHCKPAVVREPSDQPAYRILKKGSCPTITGKSDLSYEIGHDPNGPLLIRVTANSGGGFFNRDWVPFPEIRRALGSGGPITAVKLAPLFRGRSANSPGFLLAVLTAEKLIRPVKGKQRVHELVPDADFEARMEKLIASGVSLPDDLTTKAPASAPKPPAAKAASKAKPSSTPKPAKSAPTKKKPARKKA